MQIIITHTYWFRFLHHLSNFCILSQLLPGTSSGLNSKVMNSWSTCLANLPNWDGCGMHLWIRYASTMLSLFTHSLSFIQQHEYFKTFKEIVKMLERRSKYLKLENRYVFVFITNMWPIQWYSMHHIFLMDYGTTVDITLTLFGSIMPSLSYRQFHSAAFTRQLWSGYDNKLCMITSIEGCKAWHCQICRHLQWQQSMYCGWILCIYTAGPQFTANHCSFPHYQMLWSCW